MQCANGRYFYVSRFFVILSVIWKRFLSEFKIETLPNQKYYRITKRDAINSQFILVGSFLCFFWNAQFWWIFKTINFPFEIELPATIKQTICEFVVSKKSVTQSSAISQQKTAFLFVKQALEHERFVSIRKNSSEFRCWKMEWQRCVWKIDA